MNRKNSLFWLKVLISYAFAVTFPLAAKFWFNSNVSVLLIAGLAVIKPTLILLGSFSPKDMRRVFVIISAAFSVAYVTVITIGIIITPASAYRLLFSSIQASFLTPGRVANLFVFFIGFFSSTFACVMIERDIVGPITGMLLVFAGITAMVFQNALIYIPFLVLAVICIAYGAVITLDPGYRFRSVVFSCIIVALGSGLGFWIYNGLEIRGSKEIDELSNNLRAAVSRLFPSIPLLYEIPEFGFSFEDEFKKPLGSTPILSDVPILAVEANDGDRLLYIRTHIHDTLSENMIWETRQAAGLTEKQKQLEAKGEEQPGIEIPGYIRVGREQKSASEIVITVLGEYFASLPTTLDASYIRLRRAEPNILFGDMDRGFYLNRSNPLRNGDVIYIGKEGSVIPGPVSLAEYLQVPGFLAERIKNLAFSYANAGSEEDILRRIQGDLSSKYTYNLDTGEIKKGENFLDKFLFVTKSGYSTHFATALIVLSRLNGIPARYATGFLAVIPQPKAGVPFFGFKTVLTGLSAHVWPEVWIEGRGWTIIEATPAVNPDSYKLTADGLIYGGSVNLTAYTKKQLSVMLGETVVEQKVQAKQPELRFSIDPIVFLYVLLPIAFILFLKRYFYVIRYTFAKNRRTFNYLGKKIVRKHAKNGIGAPGQEGWIKWGEELKERTQQKHTQLVDSFTGTLIRAAYSGEPIEKQDVKTVYTLYRKIKSVKKKPAFSS